MLAGRDSILEGVRAFDIAHLKDLDQGRAPADEAGLARLEAKGWVETYGGVHLITLTGRALIEHPPAQAM